MRRMERMERRAELRSARHAGGLGWLAGLVLITIGVVYLLQNTGYLVPFTNWWALFLLLPAIGSLSAAYGLYRRDGSWAAAGGSLMGGVFFLFLTAVFLFGFDFGKFWPLLLIIGGLLVLATPLLSRREPTSQE